jgi:hypothetical protein
MIRVTKTDEGEYTRITIGGQLSRDYIQVVEICCNHRKGSPSTFSSGRVPTIGETSLALRSRLAANLTRLLANGIYTSYIARALISVGARGPVYLTAPAGANGKETSPKCGRNLK